MKYLPLALLSLLLAGCGEEKFATNGNTAANTATNSATNTATNTTPVAEKEVIEPPSKAGKYGGTLTEATISDPKTFNYWAAAEQSSYAASGPLLDVLLGRNSYTQKWEGRLAELPQVSADNLTFTFKLKPNLKWSDGVALTTDDIIFTLDVIYDPKIQTNMREGMMLDAPDGKGGFKRVPLTYRKIDARTIEFKFPVPYAPAREILQFPIAPRHKLYAAWQDGQPKETKFNAAWGVDVNVRDLVSCGSWILESYVPGQRLVYKRNPMFWRKDKQGRTLPYLDRYVQLIVPDLNAITLKFRAGDTDLTTIQHTDWPSFKKAEANGNYTTYNLGPSETTNFVSFNQNPKSVIAQRKPWLIETFRDVRFRRAVAHSFNRPRMINQIFVGLAEPLYGPETPANKQFYNADVAKYPYDPAKAKALLLEMGLKDSNGNGVLEKDGHDIRFNILTNTQNTQRKIMAAIIVDGLKKIGLGANFTPIDGNVMFGKIDTKPQAGKAYPPFDWEAAMYGFGGGGVDPHGGTNVWMSSGNLHAWHPYQTKPDTAWEAEVDKIFRQGAQEMDESKRKVLYNRWQKLVSEQQPLVYTVTPNSLAAVRNKYGNLKPSNTAGISWNSDEWFLLNATRTTP